MGYPLRALGRERVADSVVVGVDQERLRRVVLRVKADGSGIHASKVKDVVLSVSRISRVPNQRAEQIRRGKGFAVTRRFGPEDIERIRTIVSCLSVGCRLDLLKQRRI